MSRLPSTVTIINLKTALSCEEVDFQQLEHTNDEFCHLVSVWPSQLSVSSIQNVTVPNMFLNFHMKSERLVPKIAILGENTNFM